MYSVSNASACWAAASPAVVRCKRVSVDTEACMCRDKTNKNSYGEDHMYSAVWRSAPNTGCNPQRLHQGARVGLEAAAGLCFKLSLMQGVTLLQSCTMLSNCSTVVFLEFPTESIWCRCRHDALLTPRLPQRFNKQVCCVEDMRIADRVWILGATI